MSDAAAAPLLTALRECLAAVAPTRVDRLWLFAPRPVGDAESSLAVISLFDTADPARREVLTLHCTTTTRRGRIQRSDRLVEQGVAPADRVELLIHGVLQRIRDHAEVPRSEVIAGSADAWAALVQSEPAPT